MKGTAEITTDQTLDSRDIEERIRYLESELDDLEVPGPDTDDAVLAAWDATEDEREELERLLKMREECRGDEWDCGIVFIRDDYFEEYAEQLACDTGMISDVGYAWPLNCIDWKEAAEQLQQDYSCVELDGTTYWYLG